MLRGNKRINSLSQEFIEELKKQKIPVGKNRVYRLCHIALKDGVPVPPELVAINPEQLIIDPASQLPVRIGVVKQLLPDDNYKLEDIKFLRADAGQIVLNSTNPSHIDIDLFMRYSNENASNPNRDKTVRAIFYEVDAEKEANKKIEGISKLATALGHANSMDDDDLITYAYARGLNASLPTAVLKANALTHANTNPGEFMTFVGDDLNKVIANAKRAQELGIIGYNEQMSSFFWVSTNSNFKTVPRVGDRWRLIADYLTSEDGKPLYKEIQNQMGDSVLNDDLDVDLGDEDLEVD